MTPDDTPQEKDLALEKKEEKRTTFYDFDFTDEVLDSIESMGYLHPTPIQELSIPIIGEGKDLIACAQTGTGKTAAFLLPVIDKIITEDKEGVSVVIIAPTRELAIQIDQQVEGLAYYTGVSSAPIYGGGDPKIWEAQKRAMLRKVDIIITTPGRFIGHLGFSYTKVLDNVRYLILDEADRMLDMGFSDDITTIINALPKDRQTLMFSATMPNKIRKLAKAILNDPEEVSVAISKPAEKILQAAYSVYEEQKLQLITSLLKEKTNYRSIVVFCASKKKVAEVAKALKHKKLSVMAMHSDLKQDERVEAMRLFKAQRFQILVATDVVSRGIDIDTIDLVINYDVPRDPEDYVHRIGRTARAEAEGVGLTFIVPKEQYNFAKIEKLIEKTINKLALPKELGKGPVYDPNKKHSSGRSGGGNSRNYRGKGSSHNKGKGGRNYSKNNNKNRNSNRNNDNRK